MIHPRAALLPLSILILAAWFPASGQSVVSTHSGVIYFFEGSVFLGDQQLEQKFGKFPEIGEGRELRTEHGRAEVLLTPGVFLRLAENSSIRMLSDKLSDTQVELLSGSAILESNPPRANTSVKLIHKNWHMRVLQQGVYRIDSDPSQLRVYRGEVEVSTEGKTETVAVKDGEVLPLAAILVPEPSLAPGSDPFKNWAMSRSEAISADNATAAGIVDDPSQIDNSGLALGGFSYFPMTGIPSLGIVNPYGLSFWSPYQSTLTSMYFPTQIYGMYPGWPAGLRSSPLGAYPLRSVISSRIGIGAGLYPTGITGISSPRVPYMPPLRTVPRAPVSVAPHAGVRAVGHR